MGLLPAGHLTCSRGRSGQTPDTHMLAACRTLSLKAVRRVLEKDLGLDTKALDTEKDLIGELVDQVCMACRCGLLW